MSRLSTGEPRCKGPNNEKEKKRGGGPVGSFSFHYPIRSGKFELTEFGPGPASLIVGQSAVA